MSDITRLEKSFKYWWQIMGMNGHESKIRKRSRVPTSCFMCRTRKKKCDRLKPFCSNCSNHDTTDFCSYEKHPWQETKNAGADDASSELIYLRERVKILESRLSERSVSEELSSQDGNIDNDNTKINDIKNTSIKGYLKKSRKVLMKESIPIYYGPTGYMALFVNDKHSSGIFEEYLSTERKLFESGSIPNYDGELEKYPYFKSTKGVYVKVMGLLLKELPSHDIIMALVERFFRFCYQFTPIIDEETFLTDMKQILILDKDHIKNFKVDNYASLTIVSQLLIILRSAYITLPVKEYYSNTLRGNDAGLVKRIIESGAVVSTQFIDHAQCLLCSPWPRLVDFRYLQALVSLYTYKMNSPESDQESQETAILLSSSISVARGCGLGSDPLETDARFLNAELRHAWRKTWAQLLYLDACYSFAFGRPLMISDKEFDLEWPFSSLENNKYSVSQGEITIMRHFKIRAEATLLIRDCVNTLSDTHNSARISDIHILIERLKTMLFSKVRSFDQLYNSENVFAEHPSNDRAQEFLLRAALTYQLYTLNYVLYSYAKDVTICDYAQDCVYQALEAGLILLRIAYDFSKDTSRMFGSEVESFIAPPIYSHAMKMMPTLVSILIRTYEGQFSFIGSVRHFSSPDSIGIVQWSGLNCGSDLKSIKKIIQIIEDLNHHTLKLSVRFYSCHKLRCSIVNSMRYLGDNFPDLLRDESNDRSASQKDTPEGDQSNLGDGYTQGYDQDFLAASSFWQNMREGQPLTEMDQYNFDALDPFLNVIQPNFDSIFNVPESR
ncbi:Piso0_001232 [Millerozyma farinosa CBS 7064]|uniref:Piso0_001232 protein n=1 Tax=Pichia sorbitophila (strain ATCC MYA-4447 / BCRC 22081 / CBS 7064 / NBRC 10061 / NRRL Y-12695) TaxID=559304 RepID=G8YML6_PICSO|nr:Piso0_001232 [Millerozyma farinosa CBS 7064]